MMDLSKRVFTILAVCSGCFLMARLSSGNNLEPEDIEKLIQVQPLLEILILGSFFISIVPEWVEKVKSKTLKDLVWYGSSFIGIALIILLFPEFTEVSYGEQRMVIVGICAVIFAALWMVSYWWGKKHEKSKEESE